VKAFGDLWFSGFLARKEERATKSPGYLVTIGIRLPEQLNALKNVRKISAGGVKPVRLGNDLLRGLGRRIVMQRIALFNDPKPLRL
jgi:hypothetical protein